MVAALKAAKLKCADDGSGFTEFAIMDKDFNGYVRFKDFCRFVRLAKQGRVYEAKMGTLDDWSISESEELSDEDARIHWRQIDGMHTN